MLYYTKYELQQDLPWVTFIHGAGGSSTIWYKQIKAFKEKFNVLLIDLRGHGKSKEPLVKRVKKYTFQHLENDIIEVLDHLAIKESHFIGISLGTILIRGIGERFPERVSSMIMGGAVMQINLKGQFLMRLGWVCKSIIPYILLYKFFAIIIMPKKTHKEARSLFVREARKLYQNEFKRWFKLVSEINPLLKVFRIKDTGIPTLYIMGAEDHMFLPTISKLVKDHKSAQLIVVPSCGHVVNVQQPAFFNTETIRFIQQVPLRNISA